LSLAYRSLAAFSFVIFATFSAHGASHRNGGGLDRLEPVTRMLEVCGIKAGEELRRDRAYRTVNRVVVDAMEPPKIDDNVVAGDGGAFRHDGHWYQLSFECTLSSDQRSAVSVDYVVGEEIPEAKWEDYGLWR
jgi:hypothetical protein